MLLFSDAFVSIIGMFNMLIIINTIGIESNGIIVMTQTYSLLILSIFSFSSFNGLIAYLPNVIQKNNYKKISNYVTQSIFFELCAGIISFLIGQSCLLIIAKVIGWDENVVIFIRIYLITTLFNFSGVSSAILRIYDRFDKVVFINSSIAILRVVIYILGIVVKGRLNYYLFGELFIDLFGKLMYMIIMYRTLQENNIKVSIKRMSIEKEFLKFNFMSNISQTVDIPVFYLASFLINKYLGFSEITILKVVEKIGNIVGKLGTPIQQIIYPEISKKISENRIEESIKFSIKSCIIVNIGGVFTSILILSTYKMWMSMFLPEYNFQVVVVLILYLVFITISLAFQSIHAFFLAFKLMKYNFIILFYVNIFYIILLFYMTIKFGLVGVMISRILQAVIVIVAKISILIKGKYISKDNIKNSVNNLVY